MNKLSTILGIIIAFGVISGAVYSFDKCKVDKAQYEKYTAFTDVRFLEQHRRYIQQRLWDIQSRHPTMYHQMREYQQLIQELKQIDMKIAVFYQRQGN